MKTLVAMMLVLGVSGTAFAGKYTQAIGERKAVGIAWLYGSDAVAERKAVGSVIRNVGGAVAERKAVGSVIRNVGGAVAERKAVGGKYTQAIAERKVVSTTDSTSSASTVLDLNSGF